MTAGHASQVQRHRREDAKFAAFAVLVLAGFVLMALWVQGLTQDRDALARQVQELGGTPVAGPPGLRGEPGEPGVGVTGQPGVPGRDGIDGVDGDDGEPGKPGATGSPGSDGKDGVDGADSTVPGPTGPAGPQGVQGPQGEQGARGEQGLQGEQGPAEPECRDGYSLQAPSYDPDALVCRKDGAPDPEPDEPGNGNPQAAGALDPQRRVYT